MYGDYYEEKTNVIILLLHPKLFWWLEMNEEKTVEEKVAKLYDIMASRIIVAGTDYERITNRALTINTKGYFPTQA